MEFQKNLILYILTIIIIGVIGLAAFDKSFQPSAKEICLMIAGGVLGVLQPRKDPPEPPQ